MWFCTMGIVKCIMKVIGKAAMKGFACAVLRAGTRAITQVVKQYVLAETGRKELVKVCVRSLKNVRQDWLREGPVAVDRHRFGL